MHPNMKLIASVYRKLEKKKKKKLSRLCSLAFSRFLKENVFPVKTTKKKASHKEKSQVLWVTVT